MNVAKVVAELEAEIGRLTAALKTLRALENGAVAMPEGKQRGRPKKAPAVAAEPTKEKRGRTMSEEGKRRIAEAQRKRWATQKKKAIKTATKSLGVRAATKAAPGKSAAKSVPAKQATRAAPAKTSGTKKQISPTKKSASKPVAKAFAKTTKPPGKALATAKSSRPALKKALPKQRLKPEPPPAALAETGAATGTEQA